MIRGLCSIMCSLVLISRYKNDLLKYNNSVTKKHAFGEALSLQSKISFIGRNSFTKENLQLSQKQNYENLRSIISFIFETWC